MSMNVYDELPLKTKTHFDTPSGCQHVGIASASLGTRRSVPSTVITKPGSIEHVLHQPSIEVLLRAHQTSDRLVNMMDDCHPVHPSSAHRNIE